MWASETELHHFEIDTADTSAFKALPKKPPRSPGGIRSREKRRVEFNITNRQRSSSEPPQYRYHDPEIEQTKIFTPLDINKSELVNVNASAQLQNQLKSLRQQLTDQKNAYENDTQQLKQTISALQVENELKLARKELTLARKELTEQKTTHKNDIQRLTNEQTINALQIKKQQQQQQQQQQPPPPPSQSQQLPTSPAASTTTTVTTAATTNTTSMPSIAVTPARAALVAAQSLARGVGYYSVFRGFIFVVSVLFFYLVQNSINSKCYFKFTFAKSSLGTEGYIVCGDTSFCARLDARASKTCFENQLKRKRQSKCNDENYALQTRHNQCTDCNIHIRNCSLVE